ncbi:hypothetical protein BJ322DRAFT_641774 [Thelephora terrestris]|uniref:Uncharacterized protein n=1 Tax=Thelephora terrestris TaxID=56493 RepID=A0A9P6L9Y2_9AGAM|nr:hypothetical protein BJ322DRAFT_641774 [Thelephora terrestris]
MNAHRSHQDFGMEGLPGRAETSRTRLVFRNSGYGRVAPCTSAIVTRDHSRDEPKVQRQNGLVGATPSPANLERYGEVRSGSPASTSFSSRDEGRNTNRGDLSHDDDPQRTHRSKRSKLGSPEVHFECRICLSDPTPATNLTATLCGHLFCYDPSGFGGIEVSSLQERSGSLLFVQVRPGIVRVR